MEKHKASAAIHESNLSRKPAPSEDGGVRLVGGSTHHHAAKIDGCSDAGTLFTRIFLAAPRRQWRVLPSLPGVRLGLPVRLEDHASWKPGRGTGGRDHLRPAPLRSKATDVDAPGTPPALEPSGALPREKSSY